MYHIMLGKMTTCCWLRDGTKCNNVSDGKLVCLSCLPVKEKLYSAYKHAEGKVISALSNTVRGDFVEVMKVISRIKNVIKLRKEFTSYLDATARDYGHELHINILYNKINEYKTALVKFFDYKEPEVIDITEEIVVSTPTIETVVQSVNKIVHEIEEDPFSLYEEDINTNKYITNTLGEFVESVKQATKFDDTMMCKLYHYMSEFMVFVGRSYRRQNLMLDSRQHVWPFKPKTTKPTQIEYEIFLKSLLLLHHRDFTGNLTTWLVGVVPKLRKKCFLNSIMRIDEKGTPILIIRHISDGKDLGINIAACSPAPYEYKFLLL